MTDLNKKIKRRKMADIIAPVHTRSKPKRENPVKIEEEFKKFDKKIEEFEKNEEKRFKSEEKKKEKKKWFKKPKIKKLKAKTYILLAVSLIILVGVVYSAIKFLPKAEIKIVTKKSNWDYIDSVMAGKEFPEINLVEKYLPAEMFSVPKNYNFSFPATGKKDVEEKASGEITVYNAYSSDSQVLVANTRFKSPDGKTFRLKERVVVPGAKIIGGKITPSSVNAVVVAEEAGPKYNIGPVSRFSIPGFEGSPKYEGFYASSERAMTGGFIGEKAYATEEDIAKAKEEALVKFENYINSSFSETIPSEFKVIEGAGKLNILKEEINENVNEKGEFTIFLKGESLNIGFRESDLNTLLKMLAKNDLGEDFEIKTYTLEYGVGRADFDKGEISFSVDFRGVFEKPVDIEDFKTQILNKDEGQLKMLVSLMPNIQKTTISFWPFWVKRVPENLNRVMVDID